MADVTSVVDVVVTTVAQRSVGAGFGGLVHLLGRRRKPSDGGTDAERAQAAARFLHAVIDYRTTLTVLAGVRATLSGVFITVPLLVRQINRIPHLTTEVTDAYAAFYTVGSASVLAEADSVLVSLDRASEVFHASSRRERGRRVNEALADLDAAIEKLVAVVRVDRRFKPIEGAAPEHRAPGV
ncbi:hypothetical protein OO014_04240 [Intrasporangium calvum]|uniref:Uncharacterized protein n=1 Tax=Intrasporangium calvum TaxID=53358 RepID=A0ABT5GDW5_9MICO|nr:hypothetical protein [Intrasporangium calvum]MDC5696456.1 hypothetical protein [Intrasporangium calvum]